MPCRAQRDLLPSLSCNFVSKFIQIDRMGSLECATNKIYVCTIENATATMRFGAKLHSEHMAAVKPQDSVGIGFFYSKHGADLFHWH